jgi:predicted ATPase
VGFGVSQVLPVLVRAFASEGSIQAMEQPEIHLHPALQAEIGDVFLHSALEHGNTFLLETHSEHLILRMVSTTLDNLTNPGITHSAAPSGANAVFLTKTSAPRPF